MDQNTSGFGRSANKLLASVNETCDLTGLGRTTVYDLMNRGVLESIKIGKRRLVVFESILALTKSDPAVSP